MTNLYTNSWWRLLLRNNP